MKHLGPKKARVCQTSLFDSHEFLFIGKSTEDSSISLEEMSDLVTKSGGTIVMRVKDFCSPKLKTRFVVLFDETKRLNMKEVRLMEQNKIYTVQKSWLLDSLACYTIRNIKDYQNFDADS
jgi:hypothetical protein